MNLASHSSYKDYSIGIHGSRSFQGRNIKVKYLNYKQPTRSLCSRPPQWPSGRVNNMVLQCAGRLNPTSVCTSTVDLAVSLLYTVAVL